MTLVDPAWLAGRLDDPSVRVVDLRWREDGSARERYRAAHIPGAVHLDWTTDLTEPDVPFAFTLAGPDRFARVMEANGIGDDTSVVAYSDQRGSGPFRLWWAFRVHGHEGVRILDGGLEGWVAAGLPLTDRDETPPAPDRPWEARPSLATPATAEDVDAAAAVFDSRPPEQFAGRAVWFETGAIPAGPDGVAHTPRGPLTAGRVPGAVNVPWFELYDDAGRMRAPEDLRERFARAGVEPGAEVVAYCGVGISAAALVYALERAGMDARLYDRSWEEWGRSGRPVQTG